MELDGSEFHPAHFADEASKRAGPAASPSAKDHLQRFTLPSVSPFVDEHRHRGFRLSFPDVAVEGAQRHHAETFEAHVAVIALADVPRQDAFAGTLGGRLGKRARARDAAIAGVEPVSRNAPARNLRHESS